MFGYSLLYIVGLVRRHKIVLNKNKYHLIQRIETMFAAES